MITRDALAALDAADPLAGFRDEFALPDGVIYLDGNSLGPLPKAAVDRIRAVTEREWGQDLVRSWNSNDWIGMPARVGEKIARLIGAGPGQVVVADSTSVNLFKLLTAALELRPGRRVVVSEEENFPTDLYIAQGLCRMLGQGHELRFCDPEDVAASLDDRVAVAMLTHVNYRSGRMHDMAAVTDAVHDRGALMLWDLAHSAGAMPVDLDGCGVDLAVGCGYKFLNGGPGAPAFLYVAERHQDRIAPVLSGWMGHVAPFEFVRDYRPAAGIQRQLCGTPPVLSMAALEVAVDQMLRADMALVRQKSVTLAGTFMDLVAQECAGLGFGILSPRSDARRGSQVCLTHEHGYPIMQALIAAGVIGDFRSPDVLRFGLTPLYLRHVDMWDAVATLKEIMDEGAWERPEYHLRARVT